MADLPPCYRCRSQPCRCKDGITLYHADCRDVLPMLDGPDSAITDPVWPDSKADIPGRDDPWGLWRTTIHLLPSSLKRVGLHVGCDTDPGFAAMLGSRFPFFRVCWLEMVRPNYVGRLMNGSDVAYLYGTPLPSRPGMHVVPGRVLATDKKGKEADHPCPRKLAHVKWLVKWWGGETVLDPFAGSGTTGRACKDLGRKCILIEIEEKYVEIAARRLEQGVLFT